MAILNVKKYAKKLKVILEIITEKCIKFTISKWWSKFQLGNIFTIIFLNKTTTVSYIIKIRDYL